MTDTFIFTNRASSALAGSISNVASSLAVSGGTGTLFPNPGANQFFSITLISASNPNLLEIVYCTARSGDTLSGLLRGREGTTALGWSAGDDVKHLVTAGDLNGMQQIANSRIKLNGPLTIYVNNFTGNNTNDGLSPSTPVRDLQVGIEIALANYDAGAGEIITVQLGTTGTPYTAGVIAGAIPGSAGTSSLVIQGDVVTPSNVVISATSGNAITAEGATLVTLTGLTLEATGAAPAGNGIVASFNSVVTIGPKVVFGACDTAHISAGTGATVVNGPPNGYTISGNAPVHWNADAQGQINIQDVTITLTGTPAFSSAFASAQRHGTLYIPGITFTGAGTGTSWAAGDLGLIYTGTGSAGYLPGSGTGSPATPATLGTTGGLYD